MDVLATKINLIHWLTELEDMSVLKKVQGIKNKYSDEIELTTEQKKELDTRLEKYEKGEMHFSTWDAVKERIRNR